MRQTPHGSAVQQQSKPGHVPVDVLVVVPDEVAEADTLVDSELVALLVTVLETETVPVEVAVLVAVLVTVELTIVYTPQNNAIG